MKSYQFTIRACKAERNNSGMVFMSPFDVLHDESYTGTLDGLQAYLSTINVNLQGSNQFEQGKGYSVHIMLKGGQRKPANFDARRRAMAFNFIA
jgi:hypothetical protein